MAEYYGYFNGLEYDEDFVALVNKILVNNGVFDNGLMVSANSGMTVEIAAGAAIMNGFLYYNDAPKALTLETANASLPRIDSIMLRWNISGRTMNAIVVTGTAQSNPVAPAPVRNSTTFDFQLATVRVNSGVTSITAANITDTRPDRSVCGITSGYNSVDIDAMMTQYTAEFNDWFEEMKGQLTEDAAGNLQTQIDAITNSRSQPNGLATLNSSGKLAQMPTAADVGAVPVSRTVNGKALSGNITLTAADVGAALPNLLVNPDFAINQRGKESYTASSTQYTYDRWLAAYATVTREANTSPAPVLYMAKCVFQNTKWPNFGQTLENYSQYVGKTLTVRFWIKGLAGTNAVSLFVGDTLYSLPLTGNWQEVIHTFNPVAEGTASFSRKGILLQSFTASPAAGTGFYLAAPQVCVGAYAGDYAPPNPAEELAKCQRYYQRLYDASSNDVRFLAPAVVSGSGTWIAMASCMFPVVMREKPKMTYHLGSGVSTAGLAATKYGIDINKSGFEEGEAFVLKYEADAEIYS